MGRTNREVWIRPGGSRVGDPRRVGRIGRVGGDKVAQPPKCRPDLSAGPIYPEHAVGTTVSRAWGAGGESER